MHNNNNNIEFEVLWEVDVFLIMKMLSLYRKWKSQNNTKYDMNEKLQHEWEISSRHFSFFNNNTRIFFRISRLHFFSFQLPQGGKVSSNEGLTDFLLFIFFSFFKSNKYYLEFFISRMDEKMAKMVDEKGVKLKSLIFELSTTC